MQLIYHWNILKKMFLNLKIGKNGYPILLDENQKVIIHPTIQPGKSLSCNFTSNLIFSNVPHHIELQTKNIIYVGNLLTDGTKMGMIEHQEFTEKTMPILIRTGIVVVVFLMIYVYRVPFNLILKNGRRCFFVSSTKTP